MHNSHAFPEYVLLPMGEYVIPADMLPEFTRRAMQVATNWDGNVTSCRAIAIRFTVIPADMLPEVSQ